MSPVIDTAERGRLLFGPSYQTALTPCSPCQKTWLETTLDDLMQHNITTRKTQTRVSVYKKLYRHAGYVHVLYPCKT